MMVDRNKSVLLVSVVGGIPAAAALVLVPYWGMRTLGHEYLVYYALAGIVLAWQWYAAVERYWGEPGNSETPGVNGAEAVEVYRLPSWPAGAMLAAFALHTTFAAVCGIHLGPWLLSRWYYWIMPLARLPQSVAYPDYWLQNFELVSVVPALVAGFVIARYIPKLATAAWVIPTAVMAYQFVAFKSGPSSVLLGPDVSISRFNYFFDIQRQMPTFSDLRGTDPIRLVAQLTVVAPFYSGIAYSAGAWIQKHAKSIIHFIGVRPNEDNVATDPASSADAVQSEQT